MKVQKSLVALALAGLFNVASADDVRNDDLIVTGSQCVGFDCAAGENFGYDTIRMKENNTRVKFQDTSNSASFPTTDWQLTANESSNGGAEYFGIECVDRNVTPFYVSAEAPNHALHISKFYDAVIGIGNNTPVHSIDAAKGDTPTLRLDQDGSSGWLAQIWDVGGNESNFFVRDITAQNIPLRIRPGAPDDSLYVDSDGDIGLGTRSPLRALDIAHTQPTIMLRSPGNLEDNPYTIGKDFQTNNFAIHSFGFSDEMPVVTIAPNGDLSAMADLSVTGQTNLNDTLTVTGQTNLNDTLTVTGDISGLGDLTVTGSITSQVEENQVPDYVFAPEYELMSLDAVEAHIQTRGHLPKVPSAKELSKKGVNHSAFQMKLLEKIEELTLHTIAQEKRLRKLEAQNEALKAQLR